MIKMYNYMDNKHYYTYFGKFPKTFKKKLLRIKIIYSNIPLIFKNYKQLDLKR